MKKKPKKGSGELTDKVVVLVTCPSAEDAGRIARALVEVRLAACVNVLASPVGSIYRWKGKVENAPEHLMLIKTSRGLLPELEEEVQKMHGYKVPEVIALPIAGGSAKYLGWLSSCLRREKKPARGGRKGKRA